MIDKQKTLTGNIVLLILWVQKQGYKLNFGEAYRTKRKARFTKFKGKVKEGRRGTKR